MAQPRTLHSQAVTHRLGDLLAKHLAAANLLGRTQIVQEVRKKTGKRVPIATSSRLHVRFEEDDLPDTGTTDPARIAFSVNLPANSAADYLRGLTPVTKDTFDGLSTQYKKDAFTVSGTADVRLIQRVRDVMAEVLRQGGTQADVDKAVKQITGDAGVQQLNAFTLDTAFTTNMQKAYALGRYEQQMEPETKSALPYGEYMTVGDDRVRPEHAVLDGFIAKMDDPVWAKIYPPNGFNCRCIRVALLADEVPDDADADTPGMHRLPALAIAKVPQPGFAKVF